MKKIVFIVLAICFIGCDYVDSRLSLDNLDKHSVYVAFSRSESINDVEEMTYNTEILKEKFTREVAANISEQINVNEKNYWERLVKYSQNKRLNLFVISQEIYNSKNWEEIVNQKLYTYKSVPLAELEANDWLVEVGGK